MKKRISQIPGCVFENTSLALKLLIDNSCFAQERQPFLHLSLKSFLKEYCTVRLCTARRCGHSTAIVKVAYEYFNKVLILGYNEKISAQLHNILEEAIKTHDSNNLSKVTKKSILTRDGSEYIFGSLGQNMDCFRGYNFEAVFIDCACLISKAKENEIYEKIGINMIHNDFKFFIFVE